MATAQLVRAARRSQGLSQRDLATRSGVTQPALADIERATHDARGQLLDRLLGGAGYRLCALPTRAHTVAEWADTIYQELRGHARDDAVAFRAFIGCHDDLAGATPLVLAALCVASPPLCGDPRYDAALAALAEYHLARVGFPVPEWVTEPARTLESEWTVSPYTDRTDDLETFRRHGVRLGASELASV
jgi:transcriptional regulator with XRE-family HTH domain